MARDDEFTLTPEELRNRKGKRRRLLLIAFLILLVLVASFFAARPVRNSVRTWQARRHADRAFTFIDQQKWHEARDEASAAYQLQPNEPQAIRAVARLLSRAGQSDALGFWKNLASMTALTREDLRDEAGIALKANDIAAAEEATDLLLENSEGKPAPVDFVLAAEVSLRKREFDQTGELAKKALNDPAATRRDQLQATLALDTFARNRAPTFAPHPPQPPSPPAQLHHSHSLSPHAP